jgi:hypothetical protein
MGPEIDLPPHEQPWFQELLSASSVSEAVRIWVENTLRVYARVAPIAGMFLSESELSEPWDRSEKLRMYGFRQAMTAIAPKGVFREGCDLETAVQVMFVLLSPLVYQEFVVRLRWPPARWGTWVADLMTRAIFN